MLTRIRTLGRINNIKVKTPKEYTLSEMIQESYTTFYDAKKDGNLALVKLTESHIQNIKDNPTNLKNLSEGLNIIKSLVSLKEGFKECEEVPDKPRRSKKVRHVEECDTSKRKKKRESNTYNSETLSKNLGKFRENAKSKVFYKELAKFNKNISENKPITLSESMDLYKASNSCLTHLTVELNRNPNFKDVYKECTRILASDNIKLLESIREGKSPTIPVLENFTKFTNILLESSTELDKDYYVDGDELEENEGILDTEDDENLLENEEEEVEDELLPPDDLEEDEGEDTPVIDITEEELKVLKSLLGKLSPINENSDTVEDEELSDDEFDDETDPLDAPIEDEELEEDDDLEDEPPLEDIPEEDIEDEPLDEEDELEDEEVEDEVEDDLVDEELEEDDELEYEEELEDEEEELEDLTEDLLDKEDDENLLENEEEEVEDFDNELTESAKNRIKKCF